MPSVSRAADLLVADRLSNTVFRYSQSGELLGVVVQEITSSPEELVYLNQPTGIGISPDYTKLFVSSSQHNHVVKYDYDRFSGTATNPTIFADASDGLAFPNDIQFSPDGTKIYVANLSGGVSRFNTDGSSAGTKLFLPTSIPSVATPTSSMNFLPDGRMVAGVFQSTNGVGGGVAISNSAVSAFPGYLVAPAAVITGATGLMIHDGYIYVSGLYRTNIRRFSLSNGQIDSSWDKISGVGFPQDLIAAPDGNGFLAGILGFAGGEGSISRYAFDGTFLDFFATPTAEGFIEATAFVSVPEALLGDFNNDHIVDAADYIVWRKATSADQLLNDDTPGVVDTSDYDDWRTNFGSSLTANGAGSGAGRVPEPSGLLLMVLGFALGGRLRIRR